MSGTPSVDADNEKPTANKTSRIIEGVADSTAASLYALTYKNDPKFYNVVLKIKTNLNPVRLFKVLQYIEKFLYNFIFLTDCSTLK